ncbi:DnaJ domain-containing protein [Mycotypha africana]|uniref:DnaJ domain-containing protein n=1 Tax=Mycotypha africana TaxID=64632 RepID=UPI002301502B|nr:DnaJ domain-containing protein [Mycotypha africana]KAI8979790.1 DnaJ domain-containing protein [Mycotypha africana]
MYLTGVKRYQHEEKDRYVLINSILTATNYYEVLGLHVDSSSEEIRKAYIEKSRVCHPDKFIPPYPKATECFQVLSTAYNTLSDSSKRSRYDAYQEMGMVYCSSCIVEANSVDILQDVIIQLYSELTQGEFQTMRTIIRTINESISFICINDTMLTAVEKSITSVRNLLLASSKYRESIRHTFSHLHELQNELESLPYSDVVHRMSVTVAIIRAILEVPTY